MVDYKITEGSDYYVNIPGMFILHSWNGHQDGWSYSVAFTPLDNQRVYAVEAVDYANNRAYRMRHDSIDLDAWAYDDVPWIDVESDSEFIRLALDMRGYKR